MVGPRLLRTHDGRRPTAAQPLSFPHRLRLIGVFGASLFFASRPRDHEPRVWLTSAGSLESTAWKSAGRSRDGPGKARPRGVPCRNGGGCQRSQTAPRREETLGSAAHNHAQRETPNCPSAEDRYTDHGRWTRGLFLNRQKNTQHHRGIPRLYEG